MGFLNKRQDDDEELPGSGLHVDLGVRICPACRREALPWQQTCQDCGATPVPPEQLPAEGFALPDHLLEGLDDGPEDDGPEHDGPEDEPDHGHAPDQARTDEPDGDEP